MIPAIIVMGPGGGTDFNTARTFIINNWDVFPGILESYGVSLTSMFEGTRDFESNTQWNAFRCPAGCNRILPLDCADLDHMKARATISCVKKPGQGGLGRLNTLTPWEVYDSGAFLAINYQNGATEMLNYTYNAGSITYKKIGFNTNATSALNDLLACDATNLQPLCPRCNRSKGAK
jgi:hypothetical protein